jgi:hypothetical protein
MNIMQQLRRGLMAPSALRASVDGFMSSFIISHNKTILSHSSQAASAISLRNFTVSHHMLAPDAEQGSANKAVSF